VRDPTILNPLTPDSRNIDIRLYTNHCNDHSNHIYFANPQHYPGINVFLFSALSFFHSTITYVVMLTISVDYNNNNNNNKTTTYKAQ